MSTDAWRARRLQLLWKDYAVPARIDLAEEDFHEKNAATASSAAWLLRRHLPIILREATHWGPVFRLPVKDAAQVAHIAAWKAITSWAESHRDGVKLSTFIGNRIRWDFIRLQESLMRLPPAVRRAVRRLRLYLPHEEFAVACRKVGLEPDTAISALHAMAPVVHGTLEPADPTDPFRYVESDLEIALLLRHATPREQMVLWLRGQGVSLWAIGTVLGVCRERVRQIEKAGGARIRKALTYHCVPSTGSEGG